MQADVIVIGAGVAGIVAARQLARAGRSVLVLEARSRPGGRIFTLPRPSAGLPVELGAEFIHGDDARLRAAVRRAGAAIRPVARAMWVRDEQGLRAVPNYWRELQRAAERIPRGSAQALAAEVGRQQLDRERRRRMRLFVEGFYAAAAGEVSARSIREDEAGAAASMSRPGDGYGRTVAQLVAEARGAGAVFRFAEPVAGITWRRGAVEVRTHRGLHRARAAVLTWPLGVWRAGAVRIRPALRDKADVVARMGWGQVCRITLRFRGDWWRRGPLPAGMKRRGRAGFGFLSGGEMDFPTWWVPATRAPLMVGWCGGPAARRLNRRPPREWRAGAVASLAKLLGVTRGTLARWVVGAWHHNWTADPYCRGAYSFPRVGRESAARRLARPVAKTLFFAGEATASESGTVHGAMDSGARAAREVLAARR